MGHVARASVPSILGALIACTDTTTVDLLPSTSHSGGTGDRASTTQFTSAVGGAANLEGGTTARATSALGGSSVGGAATSTQSTVGIAGNTGWPTELIHRWDFEGTGTVLSDGVTGVSSQVVGGASLDGAGQLSITDNASYVALPAWLIGKSKATSLTIAAWVTWHGGVSWQRVFDFGTTEAGDGQPGNVLAQFYFTPRFEPRQFYSALLDGDYTTSGQATVEGTETFPVDTPTFIAVVVEGDDAAGTSLLRIYLNGQLVGASNPTRLRLSEFKDQNCWLGQSQWIQDSMHFNGSYDEFRIYARALSSAEIKRLAPDNPAQL